jgi:hypothetical protein
METWREKEGREVLLLTYGSNVYRGGGFINLLE